MKILVPVDFSPHSKNAAEYAFKMAAKLHGEIFLIHLVFLQAPPHASMLKVQNIEKMMAENAKHDFILILNELNKKNKNVPISFKVINDSKLKEVVETYAVHNEIDMIVMGTKGATGLMKVLLGSNTAAVIGNSSIPVIAVPLHARFNGIKNIVYASDMVSFHDELKLLIPFSRYLKAHLHIVHILKPDSKKRLNKIRLTRDLKTRYDYEKISFHVHLHRDIKDGISEFLSSMKCDLLVMFTHHPDFFEKLFRRSSTRELAFETWVPLLSFNRQLLTKKKKNIHLSKVITN